MPPPMLSLNNPLNVSYRANEGVERMNKAQHEFVGSQPLQDVLGELVIALIKSGLISIDDDTDK
ncbi:hypothetical protein SAM19_04729 [Brevibacillus laterosporus]|nr:hypothetical protein [Brevibacillus laterosporus]